MVKIKKMIKYENEINQKSWNGSSHTRCAPKSAAAESDGSVPNARRQRRDAADALLRNLDGKYLRESATGNIRWNWICPGPAPAASDWSLGGEVNKSCAVSQRGQLVQYGYNGEQVWGALNPTFVNKQVVK